MGVKKFQQPDHTAEAATLAGAQAHMGKIESSLAVLHEVNGQFAPYASTPPDMKINVEAGRSAHGLGIGENTATLLSALPASTYWRSITYGNGIFVAVSLVNNIVATSPDGIVWTQRTLPVSADWYSVTYGGGLFVAVAENTAIAATSPDGITWTQRTLPVSALWYSVTYGGGLFVAVAHSGTIAATSSDGITWTQRTLPASALWLSVTYGGGLFVAVASSGTIAATSPDGITWTQRTLPASALWRSITYGGGLFVAVAENSTIAATSPDGITWTQRTLPVSAGWRSVIYGEGLFVAVVYNSDIAATSPDGITWTQRTLPVSAGWQSIIYGDGFFVSIASGSNIAYRNIAATLPNGFGYLGPHNAQTALASFAAQQIAALIAPTNNPRIDRIGLDALSGALVVFTGTEATSPAPPVYANDVLPICQVRLSPGQTVITNAHITDERGIVNTDSPRAFAIDSGYGVELIPDMTGNTAPSGIASASSIYSAAYDAWKAMDADSLTSRWQSAAGTTGWLAYEFAAPKTVKRYSLRGAAGTGSYAPKDWTFEGWTGSQWDVLHTVTDEPVFADGEERFYEIVNSTAYIKYRINITANGGGGNYLVLGGFGMRDAASLSRDAAVFDDYAPYALLTTPGVYHIPRPPQARFWRITLVGGRGGRGGGYINGSLVMTAGGGGQGPGACLPNLLWGAEDLIVVVGENGVNGVDSTPGVNNATAGAAGEDTIVMGAESGISARVPGGGGGAPGLSTPAGGAAGSIGAAPAAPFNVGFSGTIGTAGTTGYPGAYGVSGTVGELGQLGAMNALALLEWK